MPKVAFDGVIGKIAFDNKGDIQKGTVTVFDVKDGKHEVLEVLE